jgi:excisionase family DNA binding protein
LGRILGPDTLELLEAFVQARVEACLNERDAERRWLTVHAAADYLGVTEKAIRGRLGRGSIAYTRQGGRILIDRHTLDETLIRRLRNGPDG